MNRLFVLPAAVMMQLCLGATYSWSVYVQPIKDLSGLTQGPVQLPFSIFYFVFPAMVMVSGHLLYRWGPRLCACIGGLLFGSGWVVAGLGSHHFGFTVLGIGVLAGLGVGLAYIVPIAICIQWFPRHKGMVTGVAVAGFGGGAALVSQLAGWLMADFHWTPFKLFPFFGLLFLMGVGVSGLAMRYPPHFKPGQLSRLPSKTIFASGTFWILYGAMMAGLAAGFAVNANLKELYSVQDFGTGILAVSLFAVANAAGRLIWGIIFDRVSSAAAIQANLVLQALVLLGAPWVLRSDAGLLAFAMATGFNYGGVLVLYASSAARLWGGERVGQVYAWMFSANIPAAAAPILAGYGYDLTGSFTLPFGVIMLLLVSAAIGVRAFRRSIS